MQTSATQNSTIEDPLPNYAESTFDNTSGDEESQTSPITNATSKKIIEDPSPNYAESTFDNRSSDEELQTSLITNANLNKIRKQLKGRERGNRRKTCKNRDDSDSQHSDVEFKKTFCEPDDISSTSENDWSEGSSQHDSDDEISHTSAPTSGIKMDLDLTLPRPKNPTAEPIVNEASEVEVIETSRREIPSDDHRSPLMERENITTPLCISADPDPVESVKASLGLKFDLKIH
jgi:hypothetical protein